jgi:hypothetical protein
MTILHPEEIRDMTVQEREEELEQLEDKLEERNELEDELSHYGYNPDELEDKTLEELEELLEEIDEKLELIEELDVDMNDEQLSDITIEQLKSIREEKIEREELIASLLDKGLDEENLRNSSTKDLRKLKEELENTEEGLYREILQGTVDEVEEQLEDMDDPDYATVLRLEKQGKDRKTLKEYLEEELDQKEKDFEEEAEEDLEMLMGATSSEDDSEEDDKTNPIERFKNLGDELRSWRDRITRKNEDAKEKRRDLRVLNLLEEYRLMPKEEMAIKTAHVMKGYLEYRLGMERELTYSELADRLDSMPSSSEQLKVLADFFRAMQREEYLGHITVDMDSVLDASEEAVTELR